MTFPRILLATSLLALTTGVSHADMPKTLTDWQPNMSQSDVKNKLQEMGFNNVGNVNCSGSICDTNAVYLGQAVNLRVEKETGEISNQSMDVQYIGTTHDMDEKYVTEQLKRLPFENIANVRRSGGVFDAEAKLDGRDVHLLIDARTGEVTNTNKSEYHYISATQNLNANQVKRELQELGYTDLEDIKKNGGVFEARGKRYGDETTLRIDAKTGRVTAQ